jgi:hypothetical protein
MRSIASLCVAVVLAGCGGTPAYRQQTVPGGVPEGNVAVLFGAPTYKEAGAKSEAETLRWLSEHYSRGGSPQQAIVDFLKTPEGARHVANMSMAGRNPSDVFQKWVDTVSPPRPRP